MRYKEGVISPEDVIGNKEMAINILQMFKMAMAMDETNNMVLCEAAAIDMAIKALKGELEE